MSENKVDPFASFKIASSDFLDDITERSICSKCLKSRKYFCYTCHVPMDIIKDRIPTVKLPVKIDIIKYPKEIDGKSTASHAAVLASENVRVYNFPDIPEFADKNKVLMIFPGKLAITLEEIYSRVSQGSSSTRPIDEHLSLLSLDTAEENRLILERIFPFERIFIIDCTWNQVQKINNDERLKGVTRVELKSRESRFWRFQRGKPHTYLSTIEAIYYFLVDVHTVFIQKPYCGEYDNLLFFFSYMYNKIHTLYDHEKLRAYSLRSKNKPIKMKGKFNF